MDNKNKGLKNFGRLSHIVFVGKFNFVHILWFKIVLLFLMKIFGFV